MLREKPVTHNGEAVHIYVEQMYNPKVTASRNQALLVRRRLKKKTPGMDCLYEVSSEAFC